VWWLPLKAEVRAQLQDASDVSPVDVCAGSLYDETYYCRKGDGEEIREYNTRTPGETTRGFSFAAVLERIGAVG